MDEEHNELKRKFAALETENVEAKVQKKALTYQLQMVEKENKKLETENESLRVAERQHIIGIPSGQALPKRNSKAALALVEELDEQYVGIRRYIESLFSACAVKEVAELQHFIKEPRRQWTLRGDARRYHFFRP